MSKRILERCLGKSGCKPKDCGNPANCNMQEWQKAWERLMGELRYSHV